MRLLTELRDKAGAMPTGASYVPAQGARPPSVADDAASALVNLGYRRPEVAPVIARVIETLGEAAKLDAVIRDALKELAQKAPAT